jgi:anti-sigma factor RsiW
MSDDMNDDANRDMSKYTDAFSENDAAYVMGALTDEDRRAFEAHLVDCTECTRSVAELSGMPAMLDKVSLARLLEPEASPESPPDLLLPRLISAARKQRRRESIRLVASGAVAASLIAVAIAFGVSRTGSTPGPAGPSVAMTPVRPAAVTATLRVTPVAWGSRVSVTCRWVTTPPGTDPNVRKIYRLVALPRGGGAPQTVAQWSVLPGEDAKVVGATDLPASGIATIELQAVADDSVLLRARPAV